ncbi:MAG: aminoglycoside 3'-phosphotransferase [Lachnospiraceae bacterium]|nr:aminoglycoside 3'-phosphotransferase [Lachnospiraceae bacterium]
MKELKLPETIRRLIDGKPYTEDDIGMSGSGILIFDDCVLKIMDRREKNDDQVKIMRWLEGKLPAPKVLCYEKDEEHQYLLMSKVPGIMACDNYYLEHPGELLPLLAEAFRMLWRTDISDCPCVRDLDAELAEARYRVENGLVDVDDVEPETFGKDGFKDPAALLQWLEENRPDYEPVLSHGDFCLPNILIDKGKISGFIDLGDTGIGDKWRDIALGYRSLKHNFDGTFGGKVYEDFDPDSLFEALGIEPNQEKLRYYTLLDELF